MLGRIRVALSSSNVHRINSRDVAYRRQGTTSIILRNEFLLQEKPLKNSVRHISLANTYHPYHHLRHRRSSEQTSSVRTKTVNPIPRFRVSQTMKCPETFVSIQIFHPGMIESTPELGFLSKG